MSLLSKIPAERIKKYLPVVFLLYGLVSVFTLQRDFSHITQLSIFVLLIGPAFVSFALLTRLLQNLSEESRWSRYKGFAQRANLSATQTLTQYILIFCLPFYVIKGSWIYFGINLIWLSTLLWDPVYERMIGSTLYRHLLLAWALISASSFLYPFVLPEQLPWFYTVLSIVSGLAFLPTQKEGKYFALLIGLWVLTLIPLLFLPSQYRFPILSVWAKKPFYAWDVKGKVPEGESLAKTMSKSYFRDYLSEGHSLCCVAPVVAPQKVTTKIKQEWTLGGRVIESTQLKTPIQGNVAQVAFHSFFCKRNFPMNEEEEVLRCRIKIGENIDIGGAQVILTP